MKIVVVEDAEEVVESIELCVLIRWPDSSIVATAKGREAVGLIQRETPDVVVLDLVLPDVFGLDVLREIRLVSEVPILIVSVRSDEVMRVKGLELGADDYIPKPFLHTELLARIGAVLRRACRDNGNGKGAILSSSGLAINLATGRVTSKGSDIELSATEWRLLSYLARNAGHVISHDTLAQHVWGLKCIDSSTIKMFVRRLRLKIGDDTKAPNITRSHRGRGYSLEYDRA